MRRGELWRSPSSLRDRVILLVTSQTLIDQGVTMLYGVEADAEDPGPLLLVVPVLVERDGALVGPRLLLGRQPGSLRRPGVLPYETRHPRRQRHTFDLRGAAREQQRSSVYAQADLLS